MDSRGLVALWREALLAQKVLKGETKGYKNHPQLDRFKSSANPLAAISTYLLHVYIEAYVRGYNFDKSKIGSGRTRKKIKVASGQLEYELKHLKKKLEQRDKAAFKKISTLAIPDPHPLFEAVHGSVEKWEIIY